MFDRKAMGASAAACLMFVMAAGPANAGGGLDVIDVDTDITKLSSEDSHDASEGSATLDGVKDSLNKYVSNFDETLTYTYSSEANDNFFGLAVALTDLKGVVTQNSVFNDAYAGKGAEAKAFANSKVSIESGAFSGFSGVSVVNINSGANSLQQAPVTIAVAAD